MDAYDQWDLFAAPYVQELIDAGGRWDALFRIGERARRIVAIEMLEREMYNGGFVQFFANWGHDTYCLALEALDEIGAAGAKDLLERCYAVIARLEDEDMNELWDIPKFLTHTENAVLRELESAYWDDGDHVCEKALARYRDVER